MRLNPPTPHNEPPAHISTLQHVSRATNTPLRATDTPFPPTNTPLDPPPLPKRTYKQSYVHFVLLLSPETRVRGIVRAFLFLFLFFGFGNVGMSNRTRVSYVSYFIL